MNGSRFARGSVLVLALVHLAAPRAAAQDAARRWQVDTRAEARLRYDDNPFLLSPGQKPRLGAPTAADSLSGRFTDMEDASDLIPSLDLGVTLAGDGLGGRALSVGAGLSYEANVQNGRRRHAELELGAQQALGHGSRLELELDWRPSYYHKNYLVDATDANVDGAIAPAERLYGPASSNEVDATLGYRRRLLRSTRERRLGLSADVAAGWFARGYDAPFAGRSRSGPGGQLELLAEVGRRWTVRGGYTLQRLAADVTREVQILDETQFGQDFNGNGNATDVAARALELVDRSRTEHELGVGVEVAVTGDINAGASFGRRTRNFSSAQPFDVADRDRHDALNELGVGFDMRLAHGLRLDAGWRHASQRTNRAGDPGSTGEVADYSRSLVWAGLRYRL